MFWSVPICVLEIIRDQSGLAVARHLKAMIDGIVTESEAEKLPEKVPAPAVTEVKNPL
jgi:hypothetical protein